MVAYFGLPMDLIDRFPGSATIKFLKNFERFIDIPRTEKERLEAWGVLSSEADVNYIDKEKEKLREIEEERTKKKEKEKEREEKEKEREKNKFCDVDFAISGTSSESLSDKDNTIDESVTVVLMGTKKPSKSSNSSISIGTTKQISSSITPSLPIIAPPGSPLTNVTSPPKKSRLGALLARGSNLGSRPNSTTITHQIINSPRHKTLVTKDESTISTPISRQIIMAVTQRDRSSSFDDTSGVPVPVPVTATSTPTGTLSKTLSLIIPDTSSLSSRRGSVEASPGSSRKNALKSSRSHDSEDLSNDSRYKIKNDGVISDSHLLTHTDATIAAAAAAIKVVHGQPNISASNSNIISNSPAASLPVPPVASSSGWKIPSDITWPTAYDKGSLPSSDYRNERFKLIPSITVGPWVVKAAVGATPVLLGKKVVQRYFRGEDYMEIDIHVGSSLIAAQVSFCHVILL